MIPNLGMCTLRLMAGDYEIIIDLFYFLGLPNLLLLPGSQKTAPCRLGHPRRLPLVYLMPCYFLEQQATFVECFLGGRYHSKHVACINTLNLDIPPMRLVDVPYYLPFVDRNTVGSVGRITCSRSQRTGMAPSGRTQGLRS